MRFVGGIRECVRCLESWHAERQAKSGDADSVLYEVRVWRSKRSLAQNAYYWALLNQLGQVLGYPSDELHMHMLRSYGVCDVFTVRADVPLGDYFRYWDEVGRGTMDGVSYRHIRAFKGSSEMDSAEFKRLLDGVISECQQVGIHTETPEEAAMMRWVGA